MFCGLKQIGILGVAFLVCSVLYWPKVCDAREYGANGDNFSDDTAAMIVGPGVNGNLH